MAWVAVSAALIPEPTVSKGAAGIAAVFAAGMYFFAGEASAWADDPPDGHFTKIAAPVVHLVRPMTVGSGLTGTEASTLNALMTNIAWSAAYTGAMTTAANRASGAAQAGSTSWLARQDSAFSRDAQQLATLVRAQPRLSARLRQAINDAAVQFTILPADTGMLEQSSVFGRVKQAILATFRQLGVPATRAGSMATDLLKPTHLPKVSFPAVLTNPQLANDAAQSATSLDQFGTGVCQGKPQLTPVPSGNAGDLQQDGPITVTPAGPCSGCTSNISGARSLNGTVTVDTPFGKATYTWSVPSRVTRDGAPATLTLVADPGRVGKSSNLEAELSISGEVDSVCPAGQPNNCTLIAAYTKGGNIATATSTITLKARGYSTGRTQPVLVKIGCAWDGPTITIPYRIL